MKLLRYLSFAFMLVCTQVQAMKEGAPGPFFLAATVSLNGQQFRAESVQFPAHNNMNAQGVYGTLCNMAQGQLQAALNTGWADKIFTMNFCKEIFDPHLQRFSQFIFENPKNYFSGEYLGEEYTFGNGRYLVEVLENDSDPTHIKMLLACQEGN